MELSEQVKAIIQRARAAGFSSRKDGVIVCYKCKQAPGQLVKLHEYEYEIMGHNPATDGELYTCSGSCEAQQQVAMLRPYKQAKKVARSIRTAPPKPFRTLTRDLGPIPAHKQ